jgi:hypothetical protein
MTQQMAEKIIRNYGEKARALRLNTIALRKVKDVRSREWEQLWAERDTLYTDWFNASYSIRKLPREYRALVVCEIEQLPEI